MTVVATDESRGSKNQRLRENMLKMPKGRFEPMTFGIPTDESYFTRARSDVIKKRRFACSTNNWLFGEAE